MIGSSIGSKTHFFHVHSIDSMLSTTVHIVSLALTVYSLPEFHIYPIICAICYDLPPAKIDAVFNFSSTPHMRSPPRSPSLGEELRLARDDIDTYPELRLLNQRYEAFTNAEKEARPKAFISFCESYLVLANSPGCTKISISSTPRISNKIMRFLHEFSQDDTVLSAAVEALTRAHTLVPMTNPRNGLCYLLQIVCISSARGSGLWKEASPLFCSCFSQPNFASELASSSCLLEILRSVYLSSKSLGNDLTVFLFQHVNKAFFSSLNYRKVLTTLFNEVVIDKFDDEMRLNFAQFLSCFFVEMTKVIQWDSTGVFKELGFFRATKRLTETLSGKDGVDVYFRMLDTINDDRTPSPNISIYNHMLQLFRQRTNWQNSFFDRLANSNEGLFVRLNEIVPFSRWFEYGSHVSAETAMNLFTKVFLLIPDKAPQCIHGVFVALKREQTLSVHYAGCLAIIELLFTKRLISLSSLLSHGFLDVFVINVSVECLVKCLSDIPTFSQLLLDITARESDLEKRERVFASVLGAGDLFLDKAKFASLCSALLVVCPSKMCVTQTMEVIRDRGLYEFLDVFVNSFPKSTPIVDYFVESNGLEWLFEMADSRLITNEKLTLLLMNLVAQKPCKRLTRMIKYLTPDHPLFSLTQEQLKMVVFGSRDKGWSRPIRVPTLFYKLDFDEDKVDPYNAFMIGKYALPRYADLSKVRVLSCIANRFMLPTDVSRVFELPLKMESFCDLSYDHFPLFQFYPGQDVMRINHSFQSLSFWFRFEKGLDEDEVQLLHCDSLLFTLNGTSLTATSDAKTIVVDATPEKWTHVYIRIKKSTSPFGSSNHIRISLNNDFTFVMTPKTKINEFTSVSIGSGCNLPLLFLGSAVRLSNLTPDDVSVLYAKGPGYIEPSKDLKETLLVTPFSLTDVELPLTCFPVPYMGFSLNNLSNRSFKRMLQCMCETDDRDTYDSVFKAACNINRITGNNNCRFWKQLLHNIKHAKLHPTVDMFKEALNTVLSGRQADTTELFKSMIYAGVLWDILNPEVLATALLECFPAIQWKDYPDSDIFLATVVGKNPKNRGLMMTLLRHNRRIPRTVRLMGTMLKCDSVADWDTSINRVEPTELQMSLVKCFISFVAPNSIDLLKSLFTFEELRYLLIVSPDVLAVKVFHLMASMAAMIPDFIKIDEALEMRIATLSKCESIWKDVVFLLTGDPDCESESLRRPYLMNLALALIWALGIQIIHSKSKSTKLDSNLKVLEERANHLLKFLEGFADKIAGTPGCLNFITSFYPLLLNYPVLFDESFGFPETAPSPAIPLLTPGHMGDMVDSLWSGYEHVAHRVQFAECQPPKSGKLFLKDIVSKLLCDPVFDFEMDWTVVGGYIKRSRLFSFVGDVLLSVPLVSFPTTVYNFLFLRPFEDTERSRHFTPKLVFTLLKRVSTPLPAQFSFTQFFSLVAAVSVSGNLADEVISIYVETMTLCELIVKTIGYDGLKKLNPLILSILTSVFESASEEDCSSLQQVFCHFSQCFSGLVDDSLLQGWCWAFRTKFEKFDEASELCAIIRERGGNDCVDLCNAAVEIAKEFEEGAHRNWLLQVENAKSACVEALSHYQNASAPRVERIMDASLSFTKLLYIAACKHFLISRMMHYMFLFCDSVFPIHIEKGKWINFLIRQQEVRSEVSLFKPVTYHLSARCAPFYPPMVLTPSYAPFLDGNYESSPAVNLFKEMASFVRNPPLTAKETLLSLFYKSIPEMGPPLAVVDCALLRYSNQIPSVSFWFAENIVILTFAQLTNTGKELLLLECMDAKTYHVFIESVLLGEYGLTTLFASHIAIVLPISTILHIHRHDSKSVALWAFHSGHFLLNFEAQNLRQVSPFFEKINKVALDSFPMLNYLTTCDSNYSAFQKWIDHKITTQEFLYILNCLSGRSYADLAKYPYIPKLVDSVCESEAKLPGTLKTAGFLYRILPFRYFANEDTLSQLSSLAEVPATILVVPEVLSDVNNFGCQMFDHPECSAAHYSWNLRQSLEAEENSEKVKTWVRNHFTISPPRSISVDSLRWEKSLAGQVRKSPGHGQPSRAVSAQLSQLNRIKSTVINVSRRKSKLAIANIVTDTEYYAEYNFIYGHAVSISVSWEGTVFAIDFAFGLTRVYKVVFSKGIPVTAKCLSEFSAGASPVSSVSGRNWVCATASGKILVLWEIISGTVHRVLNFEREISAVAFDEVSFSVWAAVHNRIVLVGLNGVIVAETQLSQNVTALTRMEDNSSVICGTQEGGLFVVRYDFETEAIFQTEMQSQHKNAITKIVWQREERRYLSVDAIGKVFQWNTEGDLQTDLETSVFMSCSICTNPTQFICQFCNKPVCGQCRPAHLKGPNCRHCVAFM